MRCGDIRISDSRGSQGASGASLGPFNGDKVNGVFTGANAKTFQVSGMFPASQGGGNTDCGIPASAVAVHINIVAVNPLTAGNVVVAAAGGAPPSGGIVNYQVLAPSLNNSNAFNVPLSATGAIDVYANCGNNCISPTVDVRGVVIGYYTNSLEQRVADLEQRNLDLEQRLDGVRTLCPDCELIGAELHDAYLFGADLHGADLSYAYLIRADLTRSRLWDTNLTDADLPDAILTQASLDRANLTGARLEFAILTGANLTGANLTNVVW